MWAEVKGHSHEEEEEEEEEESRQWLSDSMAIWLTEKNTKIN